MKKLSVILIGILLISGHLFSKDQIQADDIIKQINDGKSINYRNVEINGNFDLTSIKDKEIVKPDQKNSTTVYWYHVRKSISFIDCIFKGDVIAYFHDDWENETHNAVFHDNVVFEGCEFMGKSAFKYSKFYKKANFNKTSFHDEAFFKYAKFSTDAYFDGSNFRKDANFKYTEFNKIGPFEKSRFQREANFKYTKFRNGANFKNAVFERSANFKYTKFSEPVYFDDAEFEGDINFKYTKLNGRSYMLHRIKNK